MPTATPHAAAPPVRTLIRRALSVLSAAAAATALVAACGSSAAPPARHPRPGKPVVTVAVVPAAGPAGLYLAQMDGLFARAGVRVVIRDVTSGGDGLADLAHGTIQVLEGQWTSDLGAEAAGLVKLHALAPGNAGAAGVNQIMTLAGSPIRTMQDLAGKTIAVNVLDGLTQMLTTDALTTYGVSPASVHFVAVPFPAMAGALAAHRADAAFMVEPFATQAETSPTTREGLTSLFDLNDGPLPGLALTGYVTTQAWMARDPGTAAAFSRALAHGQALAALSRRDVERALIRYTTISRKTAGIMATGTYPQSVTAQALARVGNLMASEHGFPKGVTVNVTRLAREMTR